MPFDIDELSSSLSSLGIQKPSHFAAAIIPPASLNDTILSESPVRINSVNLPGMSFGADSIKHKGFGLDEKRPNTVNFEDIQMTIVADGSGKIFDALESWFKLIFPDDIEKSGTEDVEYFEYPNNYYGGLEIYQYDITGEKHTTFTFTQPYLNAIGSIQMAWETTDSLLLIPVSFTYRSYKRNSGYGGFTTNQTQFSSNQISSIIV